MSDVMLLGVLRMPVSPESDILTLHQFIGRGREAADRIEADEKRIATLAEQVGRLTRALGYFLGDERFHVGVGGNPIAVDRMFAEVQEIYAQAIADARREMS